MTTKSNRTEKMIHTHIQPLEFFTDTLDYDNAPMKIRHHPKTINST